MEEEFCLIMLRSSEFEPESEHIILCIPSFKETGKYLKPANISERMLLVTRVARSVEHATLNLMVVDFSATLGNRPGHTLLFCDVSVNSCFNLINSFP